jgi:hypothetical protein
MQTMMSHITCVLLQPAACSQNYGMLEESKPLHVTNKIMSYEFISARRKIQYKSTDKLLKKIRNDNNSLHVILQRDCVQSQANGVISYFPP